jgi:hypothetical protein
MTVELLKEAFKELSRREQTSLAEWILQKDSDVWDRQIEEDFSPGGAGVDLVRRAEADIAAGRVKSLRESL